MVPWKLDAFLGIAEIVCLVPLFAAIWLWRKRTRQALDGGRRWLPIGGLGLLSLSSLVPPFWLPAMHEAENAAPDLAEHIVSYSIMAIGWGAVAALAALVLLCAETGIARWVGLGACALILTLYAFSFLIVLAGAAGI